MSIQHASGQQDPYASPKASENISVVPISRIGKIEAGFFVCHSHL